MPSPYLCIGTDVDAVQALGSSYAVDDDDQEADDEFIAGWNFANIDTAEVINETEADGLDAPIFIVVFHETGGFDNSKTVSRKSKKHKVDPMPNYHRYWITYLMMNVRHEKRTRSDLRLRFNIVQNGVVKGMVTTPTLRIKKKYLNIWRSCSFPVYFEEYTSTWGWVHQPIADSDDTKIFGLLYERDWFGTKRLMDIHSEITNSQNSVVIPYRSKYSKDYYEKLKEVDLNYLNNGDLHIGTNLKLYRDL